MELTQVKSFGFALGPVSSAVSGRLWITEGAVIAEAHDAAAKALSENVAVVAGSSCGDENLSFTSFPLDRQARVVNSEAAFSKRLHILVRQKRTSEFEKINKVISASLPLHTANHLESLSLLNVSKPTKSFALQIQVTVEENEQFSDVVDKIASFMYPFEGSLLSYHSFASNQLTLNAVVASNLEAACYVAMSLPAKALVTSAIDEICFAKPLIQDSHLFLSNSNSSLCHISAVGDVRPSAALINFDKFEEDDNYWIISNAFQEASGELVAGRGVERNLIDTALSLFLLGLSRQMILIEGMAGHGKSTLTNELNKSKTSKWCYFHQIGSFEYEGIGYAGGLDSDFRCSSGRNGINEGEYKNPR